MQGIPCFVQSVYFIARTFERGVCTSHVEALLTVIYSNDASEDSKRRMICKPFQRATAEAIDVAAACHIPADVPVWDPTSGGWVARTLHWIRCGTAHDRGEESETESHIERIEKKLTGTISKAKRKAGKFSTVALSLGVTAGWPDSESEQQRSSI